MRYALLIPARNERDALPGLFERLRVRSDDAPARVLVVDNGSTDGTASLARDLGAEVVVEPRPGYGQACLAGLEALLPRGRATAGDDAPGEVDVVIFLDADDYAAPAQIGEILAPIRSGEADLVIGERCARPGDGVRWHARLGNRLVLTIMRRGLGSTVADMGPFRAIRVDALESLRLDDRNYGWYVQMQVRALRAGLRVVGVPVEFERRSKGTSKVSGNAMASVRAGWVMLRTLAVEMLRRGDYSRAETSN